MFDRIRRLIGEPIDNAPMQPPQRRPPGVVRPRVLQIVFDPTVSSEGGRKLREILRWNDPDVLARQYIDDLAASSGGYLNYQIVDRIEVDAFPLKADGFRYTGEEFVRGWRERRMHEPDLVDYPALLREFDLVARRARGEFDEVWLFAFPYAGFWESTMVGRGAFWCNSPPVPNSQHCDSRFVVMGFSCERGVDCMLENFGHRVESIMTHVFRGHPPQYNLWERFTRYDQIAPGQSQCGNVHFAPSSARDYDWGNPRAVVSYCDDWYSFPHLPGKARRVDRSEWGNGDMRAHHIWWLDHLPRVAGETYGVSNNWWEYLLLLRNPDG
ncbi:MAG TPA: hypothetical protein VFX76_09190 [Roseiflexaceae bacterium]|nr:hypothetical protein [Roseiflexaceae bacterium]